MINGKKQQHYDYLIVGSGLFGATVANRLKQLDKTVITYEYPADYEAGMEKYYTVNDEKNNRLAEEYRKLASRLTNVIFGGRLAEYKYYDMDDVIRSALDVHME